MASYKEIQVYVKHMYGFTPESCWMAHAKKMCGIPVRMAPNRKDPNKRVNPCPEDKFHAIKDAFRHFSMI